MKQDKFSSGTKCYVSRLIEYRTMLYYATTGSRTIWILSPTRLRDQFLLPCHALQMAAKTAAVVS